MMPKRKHTTRECSEYGEDEFRKLASAYLRLVAA